MVICPPSTVMDRVEKRSTNAIGLGLGGAADDVEVSIVGLEVSGLEASGAGEM